MIIRHAVDDDHAALAEFDVGDVSLPWLDEVAEIVAGLVEWRDDPGAMAEDREVVLAVDGDGVIVGVAAHTSIVADTGRVWPEHRYLMVTAVRQDHQRCGIAQLLVESLVADVARRGARTIEWLVHPANEASLSFSRRLFPEADETSPPDDAPYVRFVVRL